jgi:hypothetical protein
MFRPSAGPALALLLATASLSVGTPLEAQLTEGILSPAGRLRLEVSPTFDLWSNRFGSHLSDGAVVEGPEPLGWDLEQGSLLPVAPLRTAIQNVLGTATNLRVDMGSMRALVSRDRSRIAFGAALGVFDWLTIGASVPIVKARTELAFDLAGGDVGLNPRLVGDGRFGAFVNALDVGRAQLQEVVTQRCAASSPNCAALRELLTRYSAFATGVSAAYNSSPLFVTSSSAAGRGLQLRLTTLRDEIRLSEPGIALPDSVVLARTPLDEDELEQLLVDPANAYQLIQPLALAPEVWKLGDVEVSLALRVIEGAVRDSAGADARFRYLLGVQALARLPTGMTDHPDIPLDFGSGDGQLDLEGGAFTDLRWSRVGVRAEARYGVQSAVDLVRRVAPPEIVFAPLVTRELVTWTPGSYLSFEATPSWYLTSELAFGGMYRLWSKGSDEYTYAGGVRDDILLPGTFPIGVLEQETAETLHEVGLGLAFSTLTSWREGLARVPFEVRLVVRRAIAGSGGATPKGTRMEATGRVFWRLWGGEPELVR